MLKESVHIEGVSMEIHFLNTVIVGSGAAGLNAADRLYTFGQQDIALVTEGMKMGTSRNTGSDKQTYYKLTLARDKSDSVYDMAETLFAGGSMDGDLALVEAALSPQSFYHLVDIGVPFPHNRFGEFVGYKTDHDPRQRATSAGPLTSHYMTEKLETQVRQKDINIFDGYQVIAILTDSAQKKAVGLLALNLNQLADSEQRYVLFNCTNIIYATGGPAGIYATSVYPESQTGATGIALEAGVKGKNLTESQYGIASVKFRWNLSGTYQQVLPRYVSTAKDGSDEREFLKDYFEEPNQMLDAIFLKGYQWPFDPRKVSNYGSSLIDILVYNETVVKGRRVWLDYTANSQWTGKNGELDFSLLGEESYRYLENSDALFGTPIERLQHMNQPAIDLYQEHGIDLTEEYLEIAVCAQHNNGGLAGNIWWESNLQHFFPVGEVNGTHGVYRPGGTALNSGQVGSTRAAQYIAARYDQEPESNDIFMQETGEQIRVKLKLGRQFMEILADESVDGLDNCTDARVEESVNDCNGTKIDDRDHSNDKIIDECNVMKIRKEIGERMSRSGAHIRSLAEVKEDAKQVRKQLQSLAGQTKLSSIEELGYAFQNYDLLLTQYVYLLAIEDYIEQGGKSRGSYLIYNNEGQLPFQEFPEKFRFSLGQGELTDRIQEVSYKDGKCEFDWRPVNPIPQEDSWFEKVWNKYLQDDIIR